MKLSLVIPVFNEEDVLPALRERLIQVLSSQNFDYEIIFVNDGSTDRSSEFIQGWLHQNPKIILLELSRNFGHQQAITAGLKETTGDCVVILDADLQDPPEKIPEMIEQWQHGYKVVLAERTLRKETFLRGILFKLFYKFFIVISDLPILVTSGVFGLMDRVVVDHLLTLEEKNRFIPGLRGWVGFPTTKIYYERGERSTGRPKQSLRNLFKYSLNAIFSFSYKPLRVSFVLGCAISAFCFLYAAVLIVMRVLGINVVRGFTTPTVAIFFLGGVLLISNGIIGEYLARIYDEVKRRPLYIVARKVSRGSDGKISVEELKPKAIPSE